jgi:hypothetical protein
MARNKKWALVVNYDLGKARIESPPPEKKQLQPGWEILYVRPTKKEIEELMMAHAQVLRPDLPAGPEVAAMA